MPADTNVIYPPNSSATLPTGMLRNATLVTAAEIKSNYLWGCRLTDKDGNEMPDAVIDRHIQSAISFLEHYLNITISPVEFVENADYRAEDYSSWCLINLNHWPVYSISSFQVRFIKNATTLDFPSDWYRLYNEVGQIMLTPTAGSLNAWSYSVAGITMLPTGLTGRKEFPQLFKITYTAGFEADKIPFIINDLIAKWTCVSILGLLGNVIIAPGIAGYTVSLDGMSQGINKIPNPYMFLIESYLNQFNAMASIARGYYGRIQLSVA